MKNQFFTPIWLALFCCIPALFISPAAANSSPEVRLFPDNRVTLHARNVSLHRILSEIARQGVRIRLDPAVDFKVSAAYTNQPVDQVLDVILGKYNHALIWEETSLDADKRFRLAEIQIYRAGHRDLLVPLESPNFLIGRNPETGTLFVRHELLVQLEDKTHLPELESIVASAGGKILSQAADGTYLIRLPETIDELAFLAKLREISSASGISGAEPNFAYQSPKAFRAVLPGVELPEINRQAPGGLQMPVAVFDSGLAPIYLKEPYIKASYNAIDPSAPVDDSLGHGTQMSLLAAGAALPIGLENESSRTAPVIAIQGFDENGYTSNYALIRGISYAMENGARVLSLSWHSETKSRFLRQAINDAVSKGLTVVAAAGNEPTGNAVYPAAYESVIGVGALSPDGRKWENSNFGDFVAYQAPGFANLPVGYYSDPGIYAGTSIATAYTASQISSFLARHPHAGKKEIEAFLNENAP